MLNVFITDLAAYNNGNLIGEWITLPMDSDELSNKIKEILKRGSKECGFNEIHEEYFITDFEFENGTKLFEVEEYSNPYKLNEDIERVSNLGDTELKQLSFLVDYMNYDFEYAITHYEDVIIYEDMTLEDVAEEYVESLINLDSLPSIIANNIDYSSIARDFEISGEFTKIQSDVYWYVG